LSEVYRELAGRDKGAAKLVRARLDERRRARAQDAIAAEWAARAEAFAGRAAPESGRRHGLAARRCQGRVRRCRASRWRACASA
jgi:ATP-dependent RNA helicase SUPV3L1/SUV3